MNEQHFLSGCSMLTVARFAKAEELARKEVCGPFFPFIVSIKRVIRSFLT